MENDVDDESVFCSASLVDGLVVGIAVVVVVAVVAVVVVVGSKHISQRIICCGLTKAGCSISQIVAENNVRLYEMYDDDDDGLVLDGGTGCLIE